MKYSDFCKKLYIHSKKLINTQAWFVQAMFVAGGSNHFYTRPDSTNSSEKKLYQGERAITRQIADTFSPVNVPKLSEFFLTNLKKESMPQLFNEFGFPADVEQVFDFFCKALANQFALIIEKTPNDAEDVVLLEYQKMIDDSARAVSISKTLAISNEDFAKIFTSVPHEARLSTVNESRLHLYHLNPINGVFQFDALESFLFDNIVNYVQDRVLIDKSKSVKEIVNLTGRAFGAFRKAEDIDTTWLDNELGNILIYAFLEQVLNAPKIYNKIELFSHGHEQTALSGGGVHLFNAGSIDTPNYQLVFGKSNINNDITAAIDMAISATKAVVGSIKKELFLIENPILFTNFPEITANLLANILVPKKSKDRQAQNAFGIFLGYSLQLSGANNDTFRTALAAKMQEDISSHAEYISHKIASEGLNGYPFYFYFLPFNNADAEKKTIMQNILSGGN